MLGPKGNDSCPPGAVKIMTEPGARAAAASLGFKYGGFGEYQQGTVGALYNGSAVYFNTKGSSWTDPNHQSVCLKKVLSHVSID